MTDKYILAIDQGTTSSRAIIFDHSGNIVATGQKEHEQIFPRAGWVEHDPLEVWGNVRNVVAEALSAAEVNHNLIAAVGITNTHTHTHSLTVLLSQESSSCSHCSQTLSLRSKGEARAGSVFYICTSLIFRKKIP